MTEQSNAELIAEANKLLAENQWTSDWGIEMLAGILAERLEAADQLAEIRGETIRTYERENAEWERRVHIAERKAAEYAAVVEKVWAEVEDYSQSDNDALSNIGMILATAPADALRERDAEKWDEGAEMGHRLYAESMHVIEARNPHREERA